MKPSVVIVILAAVGLGALSTASCLVSRRSEGYACSTSSDCRDPDRTCENGYCVRSPCPSPCTVCDLTDKTCEIDCTVQSKPCGAIQCPAGFDCTIRCTKPNVCGDIDCSQSNSCDITCSATSACGAINCGPHACDISCSGTSACPMIDCADSCQCDVSCNNTTNVCPSISCPLGPTGQPCTGTGTVGENCDSSEPACNTCP